MKAVILAAGRGTRISSISGETPKCLLRFGDEAILDFQLGALFDAGVTDVAMVVGYQKEKIVQHVARSYPDLRHRISFIFNPRFAETNNSYSLSLARPWVRENDFVCLNADVLCHPDIIIPAVQSKADVSMIIDAEWRDETMKVIIVDNHIIRMSKAITRPEYSATYLGITTFSHRVCTLLFDELDALIRRGGENEFFNVAVEHMMLGGIKVGFTSSAELPWAEIDDPLDLRYALTNVYPRIPRPATRRLAA